MKKPDIEIIDHTGKLHCEQIKVGDIHELDIIAEAYSDMIDVLIEARKEITHYQQLYGYSGSAQAVVEMGKQALLKAGCTNE